MAIEEEVKDVENVFSWHKKLSMAIEEEIKEVKIYFQLA
jgi:hypothetical protein